MTKEEAAILSAYTGILIGNPSELHRYIEKILDRPVFIHELSRQKLWDKIKEKSKNDFLNIRITDNGTDK